MRIISKGTLRKFWTQYPNSQKPLEAWYDGVKREEWASPAVVLEKYPSASIVGNSRVVFRLRGGYRLIVSVFYPGKQLYIRFVGTHAQYDRINAEEV